MAALVNPITAQLFGNNTPQFDLSRRQLLELPLQEPIVGTNLPRSTTFSAYRVSPNIIRTWDNFPRLVIQYYANVPEADKIARIGFITDANLIYNTVAAQVVSNEDHIKSVIDQQPVRFHQMVTTSINGQDPPSDIHSQIERFSSGMRLAGWSDYFFRSADKTRVSAVMEGKNPWKVTPSKITEVLNGIFTNPDFALNERDGTRCGRPCRSPGG
jgi:hypothetical protein